VVGGVEADSLSAATYRFNHADAYLWEQDIRHTELEEVQRNLDVKRGELDLLAGCPPCQGFSTVRTRRKVVAVKDPRNILLKEFIRFVKGLLPKTVMLENVPGLGSYHAFTDSLATMKQLGYSCNYGIFDAANCGVPQRRKRLVLVGSRIGAIPLAKPNGSLLDVRKALQGIAAPGNSGDPLHDVAEKRSNRVKKLISLIAKNGGNRSHLPDYLQLNNHRLKGGGLIYD